MTRIHTDILVAGGGIAGLSACAAFASAGFSVMMASPEPPVTDSATSGSDLRSTAFLQPAKVLFEKIGLWDHLAPTATPLDGLRIVDSIGTPPEVRATRDFRASDILDGPFGWNIPNWQTLRTLSHALAGRTGVTLRTGTSFVSMVQRDQEVISRLSDGSSVVSRLVVGADGRNSTVRQDAGIDVRTTRYGQKALAFVVGHNVPHENVSTEIYNEGGPFTMVPLPDQNGQPASAVVWMNPGAKAQSLFALDQNDFERVASERSCHWFGPLTLLSARRMWPIISQRATSLTAQRAVILAEAAHVVPPIGAQGLNTSLNDIAALYDALADVSDPGSEAVLARYSKARAGDIARRVAAIDLFNRITKSGLPALQSLRLGGLKALHDTAPLRRATMRAGMG
jgi:2-octaprenyl-6-methoxyphenol hydroxylase